MDCGSVAETQAADHIGPLVEEYLRTATIDLVQERSLEALPRAPRRSFAPVDADVADDAGQEDQDEDGGQAG